MNPKYFTYLELVRTDTGLPNSPTDWQQVVNLQGLAADIVPKSRTQEDFKRMLAYLAPLADLKSVDQIIVYRNGDTVKWIHVGLKEESLKNRGQVIYK